MKHWNNFEIILVFYFTCNHVITYTFAVFMAIVVYRYVRETSFESEKLSYVM